MNHILNSEIERDFERVINLNVRIKGYKNSNV